jgi:hypothetical protein
MCLMGAMLDISNLEGMPMADPAKQMKTNQIVACFMGAVLIFGAFNAVMVTADEYDPAGYVWFNIALDAAMTGLMVILLVSILNGAPSSGLKAAALLLGAFGVLAGLVKLGARLSSDAGWWTGHYNYAI